MLWGNNLVTVERPTIEILTALLWMRIEPERSEFDVYCHSYFIIFPPPNSLKNTFEENMYFSLFACSDNLIWRHFTGTGTNFPRVLSQWHIQSHPDEPGWLRKKGLNVSDPTWDHQMAMRMIKSQKLLSGVKLGAEQTSFNNITLDDAHRTGVFFSCGVRCTVAEVVIHLSRKKLQREPL